MEHMETIAFIHAQEIAKTGVVTPKLATVLVVSQDTRVHYVTRVLLKNKPPFNAFVLWIFFIYLMDFFSFLKIRRIHIEYLPISFAMHFVDI